MYRCDLRKTFIALEFPTDSKDNYQNSMIFSIIANYKMTENYIFRLFKLVFACFSNRHDELLVSF